MTSRFSPGGALRPLIQSFALAIGLFTVVTATVYFTTNRYGAGDAHGGDFTLHSASGPVSLHQFRGKAVVLYFGYTTCPDVCPLSLGKLTSVLKKLSPAERDAIVPIFISVDSRKDTPESSDRYARFFSPGVIGVTGSKEEIDRVTSAYGAGYVIEDAPDSALGYTVQHPTTFYLVDRNGGFRGTLATESPAETLAASLKNLL